MIKILGQPPDCLLDRGFKTKRYFVQTPFNTWRLKVLTKNIVFPQKIYLTFLFLFATILAKMKMNNKSKTKKSIFQTPCEFYDDDVFTPETSKFTSLDELKEVSVGLVLHCTHGPNSQL